MGSVSRWETKILPAEAKSKTVFQNLLYSGTLHHYFPKLSHFLKNQDIGTYSHFSFSSKFSNLNFILTWSPFMVQYYRGLLHFSNFVLHFVFIHNFCPYCQPLIIVANNLMPSSWSFKLKVTGSFWALKQKWCDLYNDRASLLPLNLAFYSKYSFTSISYAVNYNLYLWRGY